MIEFSNFNGINRQLFLVHDQVVIPAQAGIQKHGCPPKFILTKVGVGMTFTDRSFVDPILTPKLQKLPLLV
jgi:hypothetical protein